MRHAILARFTESAKDAGCIEGQRAAVRLWWAINFPRTKGHVATAADWALLSDFEWVA